jgi:hypothetical protein
VRFIPTLPVTATANVNFTANGGTISGIVTGSTPGIIPPTVIITSPTVGSSYSTTDPLVRLGGVAASAVGMTRVTWVNSRGGSGTASGNTVWSVPGIALQLGTNLLTVTAWDTAGSTAEASLTVTLTGTSFTFTDDPVTPQGTIIQAVHIMELRASIDLNRLARGLATFAWTNPLLNPGSTPVKAVHLTELRTALNQVYQAARQTSPTYTDPTLVPGVTVISAIHLSEIRAAVRALQ